MLRVIICKMKVNLEVGRPPLYRNKTQNDIRVEEGAETGMRTGSYKMQIRSLLVLLRDEHEDRQLQEMQIRSLAPTRTTQRRA